MRALMIAAVLALGACSSETAPSGGGSEGVGGFTLEVRADDTLQTYVVTAPDGRVTAGRAAEGVSALLDADDIQDLAAMPAAPRPPGEPDVAIRVPGFTLEVADRDQAGSGESDDAHVAMTFGNGGSLTVDAQDSEGGEGRAHVRITGASEADARDFINEAEELSPEVKTEMLGAVGLN